MTEINLHIHFTSLQTWSNTGRSSKCHVASVHFRSGWSSSRDDTDGETFDGVGDDERGVDHADFLPGQVDGGGDTKDETSL